MMYELAPKIIYLTNSALNLFIFFVAFKHPEYIINQKKLLSVTSLCIGFCWGIWGIFNLFHDSEGYPPQYMFYISGGVPLIPLIVSIYKYIHFGENKNTK